MKQFDSVREANQFLKKSKAKGKAALKVFLNRIEKKVSIEKPVYVATDQENEKVE